MFDWFIPGGGGRFIGRFMVGGGGRLGCLKALGLGPSLLVSVMKEAWLLSIGSSSSRLKLLSKGMLFLP